MRQRPRSPEQTKPPNSMETRFKAEIEDAIIGVFERYAENSDPAPWNHLIHPKLIHQMMDAAEGVFDAAQDAQEYWEKENS